VPPLDTEHARADLLERMQQRVPVRPRAEVLRTVQDRLAQKQFLAKNGFAQARFASVSDAAALAAALAEVGAPAVLKSRRAGYDGKGQTRVEDGDDPAAVFARAGSV